MTTLRMRTAVAAISVAAAAGGCGFGPGSESDGEARLTVTRDYGAVELAEAKVADPASSETVMRFLDREAEITTRFGGGFVHSIEGIDGELDGGRSSDWFFYVNGIESSEGAAEVNVRAGDRIWWDYRDWTDAMRVPAVVGSWPEPFAQASAGAQRIPVRVECAVALRVCDVAVDRLSEEGVDVSAEPFSGPREPRGEALRLVVGPWARIRRDPLVGALASDPAASGVFARFIDDDAGGARLALLDSHADQVEQLGSGAGLVAALRRADDPPGWVVTGTDGKGVAAALALLEREQLADRYAVATGAGGGGMPLPFEGPE